MRDHDTTLPTTPRGGTTPHRAGRRRRTLLSLALAGGIALGGAGIAQAASNADAPRTTSTSSSASTAPAGPGEHEAASDQTKGAPGAAKTAPGGKDGAASPPAPADQDGQRPTPPAPPAGGPQAPGVPGTASGQDGEGIVSAVDASSLTLTDQGGQERTYTLDDSTTVHQGPGRGQDASGSLSASDLSVGQRVHVRATDSASSGGQATAADVDVHPAHIDGLVTAVADASITVTDRDGFTRTITTDAETSYGRDGQTSASDITTGTPVRAQGSVASDGTTLQASSVEIATGPAGGPGGPGGHGPGKDGPGGRAQGGPAAPGQDAPAAPGTSAPSQDDGAISGS